MLVEGNLHLLSRIQPSLTGHISIIVRKHFISEYNLVSLKYFNIVSSATFINIHKLNLSMHKTIFQYQQNLHNQVKVIRAIPWNTIRL